MPAATTTTEEPSVAEKRGWFVGFGILAGVLTVVSLASFFVMPSPSSAQDQLSSFNSNQNAYAFGDLFPIVLAAGIVPFLATLASTLRSQGRGLTGAAMLLATVGIFSVAAADGTLYTALWAISATPAPSAAIQAYEASLWYNFTAAWSFLGVVALSSGLLLYAAAMWNSRIYPNWIGAIGVIGGVGGLLAVSLGAASGLNGLGALDFAFTLIAVMIAAYAIVAFAAPMTYRPRASAS